MMLTQTYNPIHRSVVHTRNGHASELSYPQGTELLFRRLDILLPFFDGCNFHSENAWAFFLSPT